MATRRFVPAVTLVAALVATVRLWPCASGHYEAAPVLSSYPERHSIKTMRELLATALPETPPPPDAPTVDDVIGKVLTAPRAEALWAIDDALSRNRRHQYEARVANLWWDLRDLVEASGENGLSPEAQAYIHWRRDRVAHEKRGLPPRREGVEGTKRPWFYNQADERAWEERQAAAKAQYEAATREMETLMTGAPAALLPHYMVQQGGVAFRWGNLENAAFWFGAVYWSQPFHPRAETALFMLARTRVEQARQAVPRGPAAKEPDRAVRDRLRRDAFLLLRHYSDAYPQGRYQAEVLGWEGALYSMGDSPWMALQCYVLQLDRADQPEVIQSAGREIERCLRACLEVDPLENYEAGQVMADVAKRPIAAMRVMNYLLDGAAVVDYGRWPYDSEAYTEPEVVHHIATRLARSRSPKLLAQLAAAVAGHQQPYEASQWQPGFLAILAWAASEQGEHVQAIRLCERTPALLAASDDLQYCRAVVLQRMNRHEEALKALRALRTQFPESRLSRELDLRMAKCLHALHRDGEAMVVLARAREALQKVPQLIPEGSQVPPSADPLALHRDSELAQYQDVLESFAPMEQLEVAVRSPRLPAGAAKRMRSLLLARVVAAERWADVERVSALVLQYDVEDAEKFWDDSFGNEEPTAAGKVELARTLARFHAPLKQAQDDTWNQAVLSWHLAHLWEEARGMVTLECLGMGEYMHGDFRQTTLQLRTNALALGFDPVVVHAGLDSQDELHHTYDYCLRTASLAPQSPLAAKALHKALECLKRMAEASPYAQARAFEQDWSTLSRQLYDRLQREHPDSPEAKSLAAWWTFLSPAEARGWMPGNGPPWAEDHDVVYALKGGGWGGGPYYQPQVDPQDEYTKMGQLSVLRPRVLNLSGLGALGEVNRVLEESASIRAALIPLGGAREYYGDRWSWYRTMNALDDAELIARRSPESLPRLAAYFARFFLTTYGQTPQPQPDDATNPLADFIAYRLILHGSTPFETWEKRAGQWQQYLAEQPNSLKTEAAELQLARAVVRQYRGGAGAGNHVWPEAPFKGTYIGIFVGREKPFETAPVFAALDRYERKYPQGRYLADIRLMRGAASIDAGDYPTALRLLCGILKDDNHRELHLDAGLNLAQCFELLHEPDMRKPLAKAIANDPEALEKFRLFAVSPTCGHRLRVMIDYVEAMKE